MAASNTREKANESTSSVPYNPLAAVAQIGEWSFVKRVDQSPADEESIQAATYVKEDQGRSVPTEILSNHDRDDYSKELNNFEIKELQYPRNGTGDSASEPVAIKRRNRKKHGAT